MGLMTALAMLGSGATGYLRESDNMRQQKRQDEQDARQKVVQTREDAQYEQTQTDDQAARNAMAPTTVNTAPVAVPLGVRDAPQPAEDRGITVAGQQYPDMASAQTAADARNALPNRMQRAADAVRNPVLAAKLSGDAQTAQLNVMQLAQANRTEASRLFDEGLKGALRKGPDALATFMSDSQADGQGGAVKFKAATNPDGAWQMMRLTPDGKQTPFGGKYAADDNGMAEAGFTLSRSVSDEAKLTHALAVRKANKEDKVSDADVLLKGAQTNFYNEKPGLMQSAIDAKLDAAALKAAGKTGVGKMDPDDQAEWKNLADEHREITKQMNAAAVTALGMDPSGKSFAVGNPVYDRMTEQQAILGRKQQKLLAKYRNGDEPKTDRFGIRDAATKITPAQQAANDSGRAAILAAEFKAARTDEDRAALQREIDRLPADERTKAKALMGGATAPAGKVGAPAKTAAPATTAPATAAADEIPGPPPETRQVGLSTKPNPAYTEWKAKYGAAYAKKKADDDTVGSLAASAAKRAYNPYAQNRVN